MDHLRSTDNARPWWAEVAHLRDDDAPAAAPSRRARTERDRTAAEVHPDPALVTARERSARSRAATVAPRSQRRGRSDWFEQEARRDGRRTRPRQDPRRPERPRATLVDLTPEHQALRRAQQVRRAPGERPTVTITGRPDAALPPAVREPKKIPARRTREGASSLVASPDRMILWAVALGLLMIVASIGTATADAAVLLP